MADNLFGDEQLEFDCQVNIVDAIMGAGKTQSIINLINDAPEEEKFLVITPYLNEVDRYKSFCPDRHFRAPSYAGGTSKLDDLKKLVDQGENIVSTHALFNKFDSGVGDVCRAKNYTLVMDEVTDVIDECKISKPDMKILQEKFTDIDESGKLVWKKDADSRDYYGQFNEAKRLCKKGRLVTYGDNMAVKLFPIEVFQAFRKIYILTYRFDLQLQRYYYDLFDLNYTHLSVQGNSLDTYHLVDYNPNISYIKYDYSQLIHIIDSDRMNQIGDRRRDLSKSWYDRNKNSSTMKMLQNNISNFFRHIRNDKADDNLWTTFKEYEPYLKGRGYSKSFLALNARATNEYRERTSVAYPVNRFLNPYVKNFFETKGITIDQEGYALTEMLQFIWRSAIRDGKEIWIYVPSVRMRGLLKEWIKDNPLKNQNYGGYNAEKKEEK